MRVDSEWVVSHSESYGWVLINRIIVQVAPGTNVCNLLTRYLRRTCLVRTPRTLGMGQRVAFESFSRNEVS